MNLFYRGVVTAAIALLLTAVASQAAVLTLDDAIDMALKNRAAIIAARGQADLAKAGKRAALGAFLPRVDASYNWQRTENKSLKVTTDSAGTPLIQEFPDYSSTRKSLDIGGEIRFTLPDAVFSYLASKQDAEAAKLDVIASEQDLILAVKLRYYAYLAAVQNVTVQEQAVKRSEEQLKLIQSRFELGSAAKSDVLKQRVLYGNDRLNQLAARNTVTTAEASLAYTIGVDPVQNPEFSTEYTVREYTGTLDSAIGFGMSHRPSLLSAQRNINAAQWRLTNAKSDYLPKVTPNLGYGYNKSWTEGGLKESSVSGAVSDYETSGSALTYGFLLSWNIFDGFSREQQVTSSRVSFNNARAALADETNLAASEIKSAYLEIELVREQKSVAQENVDAATEDLKITQEKYNLGAATILDLLNAQVSLRQAQVALIQADFDYNLAISQLENAMGKM